MVRRNLRGFTVIELIVVLALVAILAGLALSRFLDLGTDARVNSVNFAASQLDVAVKQIALEAMLPGKEIPRTPPSSDGSILDVNGNGVFDASIDILLINSNVDNSDVDKIIDVGGSMVLQEGPSNNQVHIGYDRLGDGNIRGGNCRVYFRQANASERFAFVSKRTDGC